MIRGDINIENNFELVLTNFEFLINVGIFKKSYFYYNCTSTKAKIKILSIK